MTGEMNSVGVKTQMSTVQPADLAKLAFPHGLVRFKLVRQSDHMCAALWGCCRRLIVGCRTVSTLDSSSSRLVFSCDFEAGNLESVQPADNGLDYDICVRQDTYAPKHRLWFHFQMQAGRAGKTCFGMAEIAIVSH